MTDNIYPPLEVVTEPDEIIRRTLKMLEGTNVSLDDLAAALSMAMVMIEQGARPGAEIVVGAAND